jgi:hypothetical protein
VSVNKFIMKYCVTLVKSGRDRYSDRIPGEERDFTLLLAF